MYSEEAFEEWYEQLGNNVEYRGQAAAWQAALEWSAKEQEPVAYRTVVGSGAYAYHSADRVPNEYGLKGEALYLHPAPTEPDKVIKHDMELAMELAYGEGFRDGIASVGLPSSIAAKEIERFRADSELLHWLLGQAQATDIDMGGKHKWRFESAHRWPGAPTMRESIEAYRASTMKGMK